MGLSIDWELLETGFRAPLKGFGVDLRQVRADPCKNYVAVSMNWESRFEGVLKRSAILFGVHIRAPDFWKPPYMLILIWGPYKGH